MLYVIRKNIFLCRHIFNEKVILNCLKTNLCVCVRVEGWGNYSKYSKREWNRKEGRTNKIKKRWGALKKGAGTNPLTNYGGCSTWKDSGPIIICQGWISQTHFLVIERCKSVDSPQPWWDILLKINPRDRSVEFWKDSPWRLTVKWFQKLCFVQFPSCRPWSGYWYINWKVNTSRRVLGATRRVIFMVGVDSSRYHVIYTKLACN